MKKTLTRNDLIPASDEKFVFWGKRFAGTVSPDMGVADDKITELRAELDEFTELISKTAELQNTTRHLVQLKRTKRQMLEKSVRAEIKKIKARTEYTTAEGLQLGIESSIKSNNLAANAPHLSAIDRTGGLVELSFTKDGSDGVHVYSQREGDSGWVLQGYAARSPFEDKRPLLNEIQSELRRYSAVYVKGRIEVGSFSNEVVVACAP